MEARAAAQHECVRASLTQKARIRVALDFFGAADVSKKRLRTVGRGKIDAPRTYSPGTRQRTVSYNVRSRCPTGFGQIITQENLS